MTLLLIGHSIYLPKAGGIIQEWLRLNHFEGLLNRSIVPSGVKKAKQMLVTKPQKATQGHFQRSEKN